MSARTVSGFGLICAAAAALALASQPGTERLFREPVLGTTLFRAAWAYRHDRAWLESQLDFLARHRFTAIRALGVVGHPHETEFWDGREADVEWPDYDEVIAGLTDLAHDRYGIRVQWTIFGGTQPGAATAAERQKIVERFIAMSRGREKKILAFEVANEFWQNGFQGPEGVREVIALGRRLKDATPVPVALSAHRDELCPGYAQGAADFATVHFDRNAPHARWSPLTVPWRAARQPGQLAACELPAVASNNEPLGPGSSVESNSDPEAIVMAAVHTYVAGLPIYVLHTGPGVRDDPRFPDGMRPYGLDQLPGGAAIFEGLAAMWKYLPEDILEWSPLARTDREYPFTIDTAVPVSLGARRGKRFLVTVAGGTAPVQLEAAAAMDVQVLRPVTGDVIERRALNKGDSLRVSHPNAVLTGTMR